MKKIVGNFFGFVLQLYFGIAMLIFVPYYNWQYANNNGFTDWLFFGEIVPTAKAMVWPYFIFSKNQPREVSPPDVLTKNILDKYVLQINEQAPSNGPDNMAIIGASRNKKTIIYDMFVSDLSDSESANFINSLTARKYSMCTQKAENFFLSRGVGLSWNYFNSQKKFIGTIKITPQDCK